MKKSHLFCLFLISFIISISQLLGQTPNPLGHKKIFMSGDIPTSSAFQPPCVLSPTGRVTFAILGQFWSTDGTTITNLMKSDVTSSEGGIIKSVQTNYNDYFRVNSSEQTMFFGKTTGSNIGGMYLTSNGTTYRVIYDGGSAVGGGSYDQVALMYFNFPPSLSDNGNFAFISATIGTGSPGSALYSGKLNSGGINLTKIVGVGDPSPDGGVFTEFNPDYTGGLAINDSGDIAFIAKTSLGNNRVFFRIGGVISYLSANVSFCDELMLNNQKQVLYGYGFHEFHLYSDSDKTTKKVVKSFDFSPIGGTFNTVTKAYLNDVGQVSFIASLSSFTSPPAPTDIPAASDAIFLWSPETSAIKAVAMIGPVAGGGTLTTNGFANMRPLLSNSGLVYFRGVINPNSRPRLFVGDGTTLLPLISYGDTLENDQVIDVDIGDQESLVSGQGPFNKQGQLAYWAELKTGSKQGIFLYTPTGLDQWRIQNLHSLSNTGPTADTASYAGDGVSNLMKFATGMDPTKPGVAPGVISRQGMDILFTYHRDKSAVSAGVTYQVEWSPSLLNPSWSSNGVAETTVDQGQQIEVTARVSNPSGDNFFVRLKVAK